MSRHHAAVVSAAPRSKVRERAWDRPWLYKNDRPRHIDRYVDFFGTGRRQVVFPVPSVLRSLA
jgi:hypothetical protein